ncbi:hypothetical protein B0H14DRAFT_2590628 [Mycena olivaceomarginata]|nr:hypothetical protein B0H14DRAFT_2590628 [Mycena olivaceomarginata]
MQRRVASNGTKSLGSRGQSSTGAIDHEREYYVPEMWSRAVEFGFLYASPLDGQDLGSEGDQSQPTRAPTRPLNGTVVEKNGHYPFLLVGKRTGTAHPARFDGFGGLTGSLDGQLYSSTETTVDSNSTHGRVQNFPGFAEDSTKNSTNNDFGSKYSKIWHKKPFRGVKMCARQNLTTQIDDGKCWLPRQRIMEERDGGGADTRQPGNPMARRNSTYNGGCSSSIRPWA